jgi:hypothetical protein
MFTRLIVVIVLSLTAAQAVAFWKPRYASAPLSEWYRTQRDCDNNYCCGEADATNYLGGYKLNADGSVTLDNGKVVSACRVLKGPNFTGHPVIWGSEKNPFCFAVGPGY